MNLDLKQLAKEAGFRVFGDKIVAADTGSSGLATSSLSRFLALSMRQAALSIGGDLPNDSTPAPERFAYLRGMAYAKNRLLGIEVGSQEIVADGVYLQTDANAFPQGMHGALVTIKDAGNEEESDLLVVAYSFVTACGQTGEGTMQKQYAVEFLRSV